MKKDEPKYPNVIPLSKLIIYGTCKKCGGYLVNTVDNLTASFGCLNIACNSCGTLDMEVEENIREIHKKHQKIISCLTFGDAQEIIRYKPKKD